MSVWFCTACGTPSGSLAERCLHCGAPRPGAEGQPAQPVTGPVPIAQYEVYAPPPGFGPSEQPGFGPPQEQPHGAFEHAGFGPPQEQPHAGFGPPPEQPAAFGAPPEQPAAYSPPPAGFEQPAAFAPQPEAYAPPGEGFGQPSVYQAAPAFGPAVGYGPPPGEPPGQRRWWVPVLVVLVLLLAGGAIATVVLVERDGGGDTADPGPAPTTAGVSSPARVPSSPTASASPSGPPRLVTTDASVTDARAADVAALFEDYFTAINDRDYDRALSAYDPAGVINPDDARQAADFKQAIGTTTDSQIVLRSVGPPASGRGVLDARVTFRSNQQPGYGPKERPTETCTAWDVTYALSQPAGAYKIVIGKATHAPC